MSKRAVSPKRFTISELAKFFKVGRNTMARQVMEEGIDLRDPVSVLEWLIGKNYSVAPQSHPTLWEPKVQWVFDRPKPGKKRLTKT